MMTVRTAESGRRGKGEKTLGRGLAIRVYVEIIYRIAKGV
jgi:hypothetical protein